MVFSSLTFLLWFLPCVLIVYFAVPNRFKNTVLFLFSLLFYAWGEPVYVGLMVFSTVLDYCCGRAVDKYRGTPKAKIGLLVSVIVNLSLLCLFKYTDFLIGTVNSVFGIGIPLLNLPLPIGISFYTFQTMSYTIDVYRGDAKVQKNIISFGAYVSLFPQLIAGPIVRYQTIADQIDERTHSFDKFGEGVKRFVCGLGKKVLLANNIGILWSEISKESSLTVLSAWLGIIAFSFQIYFDFSGYSDMAIGLGKMFGFDFPENFDYPYISKSITEFWRRWHISMGTWFRDYVYIPLGGNRKGLAIQLRNIAVVWLLTGFWHGASWNYVLWGVFYGVILIIEKFFLLEKLKKTPAFVCHIYSLLCVAVGWVLFAFEDFGAGIEYLKAMFGQAVFCDSSALYRLLSYFPLLLLCSVAATPFGKKLYQKLNEKRGEGFMAAADITGAAAVAVLSVTYLISGSYNPFLYFRF
ncbi:MAG: MBOAT family protein [Clostridia bacterium]|nr:MBOAT family protein [Clostridia bacterium]